MSRIRETLARLRALAQNAAATDAERRAAQSAHDRLLIAHNLREEDLTDAEATEPAVVRLSFQTPAEEALIESIGWCLGLEVYELRTRSGRVAKRLMLKGDPLIVDLAAPLYRAHRKRFNARILRYSQGLAMAMFPPPPAEPREESADAADGLTEDERDSLIAGLHGAHPVPIRALPEVTP